MKIDIKKISRVCIIFILLCVCLNFFNNTIYAEINKGYSQGTESIDLDEDEVIESSPITNYIGSFIYTIGVIIERLTSNIMAILTGDKVFPWADQVIFNTIPILDVNFINPNEKSLLDVTNGIGEVIRNIYFTGLSIALGFLGIVVAVMAIKLVISTIASEKAKYKEAIVKWLTAIVLLFSMHFVLSFLFYMNEQLVIMASDILADVMRENGKAIQEVIDETLEGNKQRVVLNFCNKAVKSAAYQEVWASLNPLNWVWNAANGIVNLVTGEQGDIQQAQDDIQFLYDNYEITYALITNPIIKENVITFVEGNNERGGWNAFVDSVGTASAGFFFNFSATETEMEYMRTCVNIIKTGIGDEQYNSWRAQIDAGKEQYKNDKDSNEYIDFQIQEVVLEFAYRNQKYGTLENDEESFPIIGKLGDYFKTAAWYTDIDGGGWSPSSASIIGATLYTMFVFQSLMFFIAYIKRFFYVVILSVIAPFVIIYDFFTKSATL